MSSRETNYRPASIIIRLFKIIQETSLEEDLSVNLSLPDGAAVRGR